MRTSTFLFAYDLVDEGTAAVMDNVADRAGLDGLSMAAAYHHGRDIFPHSPVRKVRFLDGGTVYFHPDESLYPSGLKPVVGDVAKEVDVLSETVAEAARRDLDVHAWTVYFHNTRLGSMHPELTTHNAFGDPYHSDLCPSHPDVRELARGLTADIASRGVKTIIAESMHFGLFQHGHHHERYFLELGSVVMYLLGICFCDHCRRVGEGLGVDVERIRSHVVSTVESVFEGGPAVDTGELDVDDIRALVDGEMGSYLDARAATVTSLTRDVASTARDHGARFSFIDPSGAMKGYASGSPTGPAVPESSWMFGTDIAEISAVADVEAIGYAADPDRVRFDLEAYGTLLGDDSELSVALRPMYPDCDDTENLAAKLRHCRELGIARVDFYHYGFIPLAMLDRIHQAVVAS